MGRPKIEYDDKDKLEKMRILPLMLDLSKFENLINRSGTMRVIYVLGDYKGSNIEHFEKGLRLSFISFLAHLPTASCLVALHKLLLEGYVEKRQMKSQERNDLVDYYNLTKQGKMVFGLITKMTDVLEEKPYKKYFTCD